MHVFYFLDRVYAMDPSKVDWNHPSVKYLFKCFEEATNARDKESEQTREMMEQVLGENRQLREENEAMHKEIEQLHKENEAMHKENEAMHKELEQLRGDNKQAVAGKEKKHGSGRGHNHRSYNVREMKGYPQIRSVDKNDGTKRPSHRIPPTVNDIRQADQTKCPNCGAELSKPTGEYERLSEDLIEFKWTVTKWCVSRRFCRGCNKQVTPYLDGVLAGEHFGTNIMAMVITMKCSNVSFGKIRDMLHMFYGISISTSTLNHFCDVVARELEPLYDKLKKALKRYREIYGDETSWFVNGIRRWVWVFVSSMSSIFVINKSRGRTVPMDVLKGFTGIIVSDSWGPWNYVGSKHQKCLLHYLRDMYRTLEKNKSKKFVRFFRTLYKILKDAIEPRKTDCRDSAEDQKQSVQRLKSRVHRLINKDHTDKDCKRYAKRLKREVDSLFTFIEHEGVDYHNNVSEQALRRFAEARKVLYGSRTEKGAKRTAVTMSIHETCKKRGVNFYEFVRDYLAGRIDDIPKKRTTHATTTITTMAA